MTETLAEQWFRRVWREEDATAIDELLAEDGVAYGILGDEIRGRAAFKQFHAVFLSVFSDVDIEVQDEIALGRHVAVRCHARMTLRALRTPVEFAGMGFIELDEHDQISVAYNFWNFLGLLEQMELLPRGSFELALTGALPPNELVGGSPAT